MVINLGITGDTGFIGTHLKNIVNLDSEISIVPFQRTFFNDPKNFDNFVSKCDVIVHLAAKSRGNEESLYTINMDLTNKLVQSLERTNSTAKLIFSSSIHEKYDSAYGRSKKDGYELLLNWALSKKTILNTVVIPNVFGPFCNPEYTSVNATFCYNLTHNKKCEIIEDASLHLIYIGNLIGIIINLIKNNIELTKINVNSDAVIQVSELLSLLTTFYESYFINQIIPPLSSEFIINLFNTFRSYIDGDYFPKKYIKHTDDRGSLVEIVKHQSSGQSFYSVTKPGITRGNHYHIRKMERFSVISGKAVIKVRRIDSSEIKTYYIDGDNPAYVDMPIFYTHNITNVGDEDLYTIFWTNEIFNKSDPDTYYISVE